MERLRRLVPQFEPALAPEVPGLGPVPTLDPAAPPTVQVVWGPIIDRIMLVGMTVAAARDLLRRTMNIAPNARTLVNGEAVTPDHRLTAGETLEFIRAGGEKGAGM